MADAGTRFVLRRLNWMVGYGDRYDRRPGDVAVASFGTFDEADAERLKRETELRKKVNPFLCGQAVHYWTHLDEPRLRDWLMDHGIDPPAPKKDGTTDWAGWWKKAHKTLAKDKQLAVWEALDKVRFFVVREEPARAVGYAVIAVNWEYNDENYSADAEGGHLEKVYRSRERADAECARLNDEARDEWSFVDDMMDEYGDEMDDEDDMMAAFDMQDRLELKRARTGGPKLKKNEGLFNSSAKVPFYEVVEVELEGLE